MVIIRPDTKTPAGRSSFRCHLFQEEAMDFDVVERIRNMKNQLSGIGSHL